LEKHGWQATSSTSLEEALDGADIVIHQIRYGDLQGRASGEEVCQTVGLPPDETLGPAALLTAIQTMPALHESCDAMIRYCPGARILNLTNPLSSITAAISKFGVRNCVGLCELPLVTMQTAAKILNEDPNKMSWTYCGLNHRGFIDTLSMNGDDMLARLPGKMGTELLGGIEAAEIAALKAIPLKYFRLTREIPKPEFGRAAYLAKLRNAMAQELSQSVAQSPASMQSRYMDWYPKSVVPLVHALSGSQSTRHVINVQREDGLVVETLADVSHAGMVPDFHQSQNESVRRWNAIFENHEQSFINAMLEPTESNLQQVFESDPIVPDEKVAVAVQALRKQLATPTGV